MSGERIECFVLKTSDRQRITLRRYAGETKCPDVLGVGYHNASVEVVKSEPSTLGDLMGSSWLKDGLEGRFEDDPRWPRACRCGYAFAESDHWQINAHALLVGVHPIHGAIDVEDFDHAPAGAMVRMPWYESYDDWKGPDGESWAVMTPAGVWHIDGKARDNGKWSRSGVPPKLTVTPSISIGIPERYHGFLTDGFLVPV